MSFSTTAVLSAPTVQGCSPSETVASLSVRLNERDETNETSVCKRQKKDDSYSVLLEPYNYLCAHPGKEVRSQLISAFDHWLQVPKEQLEAIKRAIEMLHTASLLIDDVQDGSTLRRGVPVAHHIYGVAQTINCANYVYFLALEEISRLNNPEMLSIFTAGMIDLHRGQGMELYWRDTLTCPAIEEYIEMVNCKTGGLLRLAVKLMQAASESKIDYTRLVNKIGIHFQIRDDYMNLQSDTYKENKGFCEDLTEGKFSYPVIHSIQSESGNHQLINILKQRSESVTLKKFALQLIEKTGTFAHCRAYLAQLESDARQEVALLGGNPLLEKILDALSV